MIISIIISLLININHLMITSIISYIIDIPYIIIISDILMIYCLIFSYKIIISSYQIMIPTIIISSLLSYRSVMASAASQELFRAAELGAMGITRMQPQAGNMGRHRFELCGLLYHIYNMV
jgi:hypothetical protein